MSSYWAGYAITGLVLTQSEFNAMLNNYKKKNPDQNIEEAIEDYGVESVAFIMSAFAGESMPGLQNDKTDKYNNKIMYITELSDDSVDGVTFWPFYKPDGKMNIYTKAENGDWESVVYSHPIWDSDAEFCYIIESDKDMSSPLAFEKKPYDSYQGFVQEFKNKLETYLPKDFDWDAHLGYISYASYA